VVRLPSSKTKIKTQRTLSDGEAEEGQPSLVTENWCSHGNLHGELLRGGIHAHRDPDLPTTDTHMLSPNTRAGTVTAATSVVARSEPCVTVSEL
jgi:hypothetical protein